MQAPEEILSDDAGGSEACDALSVVANVVQHGIGVRTECWCSLPRHRFAGKAERRRDHAEAVIRPDAILSRDEVGTQGLRDVMHWCRGNRAGEAVEPGGCGARGQRRVQHLGQLCPVLQPHLEGREAWIVGPLGWPSVSHNTGQNFCLLHMMKIQPSAVR